MGHRAVHILVAAGRSEAIYSQWGALSALAELAEGPSAVRASLLAVDSHKEPRTLPAEMLEAGILIDEDERLLICCSQHLEEHPKPFLRRIKASWAGWTICWDDHAPSRINEHLRRRGMRIVFQPEEMADEGLWIASFAQWCLFRLQRFSERMIGPRCDAFAWRRSI